MASNLEKRNYLIDNLKVILIFSVVFGHTIEYYIDNNSVLRGIYMYIYIFHMPLFIYISGYLSKKSKSTTKMISSLLIPYVFFNILWYTGVYFVTGKNMFSLIYPGWTLWYLISLFFWRISLKYITKIKYILPITFILGLLIGLNKTGENVLSLSRTIVFLPFFLLGYYTSEEKLNKISDFNKIISIAILIIFIVIALYIAKYEFIDYKFLYNSHAYYTNNLNIIQGLIFRTILYICSIMLSIAVISFVPSEKVFFTKYGKNTMNIYVFHIYLVVIVLGLIPKWNENVLSNIIVLLSPLLIMYILSLKFVESIYNFIFEPIVDGFNILCETIKKIFSKIINI